MGMPGCRLPSSTHKHPGWATFSTGRFANKLDFFEGFCVDEWAFLGRGP